MRPPLRQLTHSAPLVRVKPADLVRAGVTRVPRVAPEPIHGRGVVGREPGLYLVGLTFLYAMSSGFLPGVGRDAGHVADHVAARSHAGRAM